MAKTKTISSPGKKPITFHPGGLHKSLGVKPGSKIPASKMSAALAGKHGAKAKKQALFAKNVLGAGRKKKRTRLLIKAKGSNRVTATKEMKKRMGMV